MELEQLKKAYLLTEQMDHLRCEIYRLSGNENSFPPSEVFSKYIPGALRERLRNECLVYLKSELQRLEAEFEKL